MVQAPEPAAPVAGKPIEPLRRALAEQSEWTAKVLARFAAYHLRIHLRQIQDVRAAPGLPRA
jgi:hypothetical protein